MTTPEGKCTVGGNRKCNHLSWDEFGGYRDGCAVLQTRNADWMKGTAQMIPTVTQV